MIFQVICMNPKGFILEHNNFQITEVEHMLRYIERKTADKDTNKIEITRWIKGVRV